MPSSDIATVILLYYCKYYVCITTVHRVLLVLVLGFGDRAKYMKCRPHLCADKERWYPKFYTLGRVAFYGLWGTIVQ